MSNRFSLPPFAARIILIGVLIVQVVTHLAWLPISTQVGQMTIPWLMSRGWTMFGNILENRPPATAAIIALLLRMLPGVEQILLVRALNLIVILAITLLVYRLTERLTGSTLAAALALLFWALCEPVYGNLLFYFDTIVGLQLMVVALIALDARHLWQIALCGLLLGLATLFKQPAWAAVALFGLWLAANRRWHDLIVMVVGALVFPLLTVIVFALQGHLSTYLFWNFGRYLINTPDSSPLSGMTVRKLLLTEVLAPAFVLSALRQPDRRRWLLVAVLWLEGGVEMLPNFGEIYVMAHLPLLAVMSGAVLAQLLADAAPVGRWREWIQRAATVQLTVAGIALVIAVGWVWVFITPYIPGTLGRAKISAYDEFIPVSQRVNAIKQLGDTLYVLPMLDGNPQIFVQTDMLPPGLWVTSNSVFLAVPGVADQLLAEWAQTPPDIVVDFPDLHAVAGAWVLPLTTFVESHYHAVDQIDDVPFNGDAIIYRLNESLP